VPWDFVLYVAPYGLSVTGDPAAPMVKLIPGASTNLGRFNELLADALFDKQKDQAR
jgi:hypothetical protein